MSNLQKKLIEMRYLITDSLMDDDFISMPDVHGTLFILLREIDRELSLSSLSPNILPKNTDDTSEQPAQLGDLNVN